MSFLEPEITNRMDGWQVETKDNGTCFVPGYVQPVPVWLAHSVKVSAADDAYVFGLLLDCIADYIPAHHVESIEACSGYFARLSAPGYLDCTDWGCYSTLREARASLRD